jgi:RNase P/RNase MRP subunit POP5
LVRVKHRYVLVESAAEAGGTGAALQAELLRQMGGMLYPRANPKVLDVGGRLVIRCSLDGLGSLIVALSMIKAMDGRPAAFYTIRTSGTLRALLSKEAGHGGAV